MPQGVGYGPQTGQPQKNGLAAAMPNAAAVADQFQNQQKPFGWLMDMIQHITGQMQPQQPTAPAAPGQPVNQPQTQQQQTPPPGAGQGTNSQPGQKQSQAQPAQPGQPGMIDPNTVQQLVSLFQPNALSNLGLLPQQQGSWNWVLSMMQQGQAAQAQQKGAGGNDLISLVRSLGQGGGSMVPEAGGASKPAAKTPAKG